jgi:hypothetical protein
MGDLRTMLIEADALRKQRQAVREERHEATRRRHRIMAMSGGGERECARRRRQATKGMR